MTLPHSPDPNRCPEAGQNGTASGPNPTLAAPRSFGHSTGPQGAPGGPRHEELRELVLTWAEQHAPDMTTRRVNALVSALQANSPARRGRAIPGALTPKPRATAGDARAIAARLEARPLPDGCRHCGGHCAPGRLACDWCRGALGGEQS